MSLSSALEPHGFDRAAATQHFASALRYRADIDGLRAIAIMPVVLFHAGFPGVNGGFVGVDVFFVISGFLMASLIVSEIDRGSFSLVHFYERRVRRIFPALFATIAATAVAAWMVFMPVEFQYFARSAAWAALFGSNILFWQESGYFDTAAQLKPLLHTWSLAVEEQFYIVFPLLLVLLTRLGRRWLAPALCVLLGVSLGWSIWQVADSPVAAFYLSPARFWELLLGAVLVFEFLPRPKSPIVNQACALLGILLIGYAVFTYDDDTSFPGLSALVPCLGAALVIYGRAESGPLGRLLSSQPLVFIGLISYSLYLWHWPLIVFTRYFAGGDLSIVQRGLVVAAALVLATLSWRFIERPFRGRASPIGRIPLLTSAVAAVAAAMVFGVFISVEKGLPSRLPIAAQALYRASYDTGSFANQKCFTDVDGKGPSPSDVRSGALCGMGASGSKPEFLVWGDSHAAAMAPAIDVAARESGDHGVLVGHGGCPPLLNFEFGEKKRLRAEQCQEYNEAVVDLIAARHIPVVFMVAFWPKYVHRAELPNKGVYYDPSLPVPLEDWSAPVAEGLDHTLAKLSQLGTHVVLVMDVPEMGYNVPEALAKAVMTAAPDDIAPSWQSVSKRQALARATLATRAVKYGATVIDPLPALCDDKRCFAQRNGIVLYHDSDHMTAKGAESISYIYAPFFGSLHAIGTSQTSGPVSAKD